MAGNDRGDRKSWRERDAQKDRSGSQRPADREKSPGFGTAAAASSKQHRAQLDALFEKGGFAKLAEKLAPAAGGTLIAPSLPLASDGKSDVRPQKPRMIQPVETDGRIALRKKIVEAIGRDEITRAVDRYLKDYPMPVDFEVLEQVIEHRKIDRMSEAMTLIEQLLEKEKPKRSRVLNAKLRLIEETTDERDMSVQAARIRAKLG